MWNVSDGVWNREKETDMAQSKFHVQLMETPQPGSHNLIPLNTASNKPCALCKKNNIRTATGLPTKTYYKCDTCNVCLCRPQVRDCFVRFHNMMMEQDSLPN